MIEAIREFTVAIIVGESNLLGSLVDMFSRIFNVSQKMTEWRRKLLYFTVFVFYFFA